MENITDEQRELVRRLKDADPHPFFLNNVVDAGLDSSSR